MFRPNTLAFLTYLWVDLACMWCFVVLRRNDLLLHHLMSLFVYTSGSWSNQSLHYLGTVFMLCESISLMNSVLPHRPLLLYRLVTIGTIRGPIWIWCLYWLSKRQQYGFMCVVPFFIMYDGYIGFKMVRKLLG